MRSINPFSRFSDPYISPQNIVVSPQNTSSFSINSVISAQNQLTVATTYRIDPVIVRSISDLPNDSIIVFRGSPTGYCQGPNVAVPQLNLNVDNSTEHSQIFVSCISTYPQAEPYNPIADRYQVHVFPEGWIATIADGCGLDLASRQAPHAAMQGFWDHLSKRLRNDQEGFKVQKLAHYLYESIEAAHFNIYWDALLRNQEKGYHAYKNQVVANLLKLKANQASYSPDEFKALQDDISNELMLIIEALKGDTISQKKLVENQLHKRFFEHYAGATTFLCSALIKNASSSEYPYYLLSVSLGDSKGYLFRNGSIIEITKDNREDISNARDPGGKIGLCTLFPLLIDNRNLQYSLTPCMSGDLLFFVTDGVADNLDPERLGLLPNAKNSSERILNKIKESAGLDDNELNELLSYVNLEATSWKSVSLEEGNKVKSNFGLKLFEKIVTKANSPKEANEIVSQFCYKITSDYRDEKPHYFNLFDNDNTPIGKPDHTTCLTIQVQ